MATLLNPGCDRLRDGKPACALRDLPWSEVTLSWDGPAKGRKACYIPKSKRVYLDSAWWDKQKSLEGRKTILFHELGHAAGAECEACADFYAGHELKRQGSSDSRDARHALLNTLQNRDPVKAGSNLERGFKGLDEDDTEIPTNLKHAERLDEVDTRLRAFAIAVAKTLPGDWAIIADGGVRTNADQARLYAQGRTTPGKVVTKAETANDTPHGRGMAIDIGPYVKGDIAWNDTAAFQRMGGLAKSLGFSWGGDWTDPRDMPHVEITNWRTTPKQVAIVSGEIVGILLLAWGLYALTRRRKR